MGTLLRSRTPSRSATGLIAASLLMTGCSVSAPPSNATGETESPGSSPVADASLAAPPSTPALTLPPTAETSPNATPLPTIESDATNPPPTPAPAPHPKPSLSPGPTSEPSESLAPSTPPTPTPWPFATISGIGHLEGRPFTIDVWIDHEGGAHGVFDGSVADPSGPNHVTGAVTCARIDGNTGVFGGRADWTDFVVMVSDRPNGMIIGTGRPDCDTTGFGDPASSPTTDGDIHVIPEP